MAAVAKLEHRTTKTELRSFLSICITFRGFDPSFAHCTVPLNKKLERYQRKQSGPLDEKKPATVASLIEALIRPAALALLEAKGWYTLDTNAYDK